MKNCIRILFFAFAGLTYLSLSADNPTETINNIKRAADKYFFAQSTVEDKAQAKLTAENLLIDAVSSWLDENSPGTPFSPALASEFKYIEVPRGRATLVFAYLERSVLTGEKSSSKPQEPEIESYSSNESSPKQVDSDMENQELQAQSARSLQDELRAEITPVTPEEMTAAQKSIIKELLEADDLQDAFRILEKYQTRRKVKKFGDISTVGNKNSGYLVIGSNDLKILTVLSPGKERTNYKTGLDDNLNNYRGNPVIWFIFY